MRVVIDYDAKANPPLLTMYVHDAPHRRMHVATIQKYREIINAAAKKIGIEFPIPHSVDLKVLFINPSSPDLGNIYLALERALDNKTLKKPALLEDDSLISQVKMTKLFT